MMGQIRHSVDGRYDIYLDTDDIEIVRLMLAEGSEKDVVRELKAGGKTLSEIVALIREARGNV